MIHSIDPIAFSIGTTAVPWYWLFYPFGFLILFACSLYYLKKSGLAYKINDIIDFFIIFWLGIILGGRLGYLLLYQLELLIKEPRIIWAIELGGMSVHGAFLGCLISFFLYKYIKKQSPVFFIDILVLYTPIALMLGRIGNFINGELWGRPSDLPWAMVFSQADELTRHPSQIYQAIIEGPVLFTLMHYFKDINIRWHNSLIFLSFYFFLRFVSEFFREPDAHIGYLFNFLTYGQILSLIGFCISYLFFIRIHQKVDG